MKPKIISRTTWKYKKGQIIGLDDVYEVQGLIGGNWIEGVKDDFDEDVRVLRDIYFEVIEYETTSKTKKK